MFSDTLTPPWICACPHCSLAFQTKTFFQGRLCHCPHCHESFTLPRNPPSPEELQKGMELCLDPQNITQSPSPALVDNTQKQRRRIRKRLPNTAATTSQKRGRFFILGSFFLFLAGCLFLVFIYQHYKPTPIVPPSQKEPLFEVKPKETKEPTLSPASLDRSQQPSFPTLPTNPLFPNP